jgi:hypothetical protein
VEARFTAAVFAEDLEALAADSEGFGGDLEAFAEASGALAASADHSSGQVSGAGLGSGLGLASDCGPIIRIIHTIHTTAIHTVPTRAAPSATVHT